MFINFFQALRHRGIPVTFNEWLLLQQALTVNLVECSLSRFYMLARSILVKTEGHFDKYDQAFLECFGRMDSSQEMAELLARAIQNSAPVETASGNGQRMARLQFDDNETNSLQESRQRDTQPHEGGDGAIGQRGCSTQGAYGSHTAGVRGKGAAVQIADRREFANYRDDLLLDTRSMKMALSYLRQVHREGPKDELNVERTIDSTCRNGGELDLVWARRRKKRIKLILLMDAGGTMTPYAEVVSRLFSAAKDVVKDLRFFYFHNCIYEEVYTDISQRRMVSTRKVLEQTGRDYKAILVGDAYMAPTELFSPNGAIDYWYRNERPGIEWLIDIRKRFRKAIWLNPEPQRWWNSVTTTKSIMRIFPMYELTLAGLRAATRNLMRSS